MNHYRLSREFLHRLQRNAVYADNHEVNPIPRCRPCASSRVVLVDRDVERSIFSNVDFSGGPVVHQSGQGVGTLATHGREIVDALPFAHHKSFSGAVFRRASKRRSRFSQGLRRPQTATANDDEKESRVEVLQPSGPLVADASRYSFILMRSGGACVFRSSRSPVSTIGINVSRSICPASFRIK